MNTELACYKPPQLKKQFFVIGVRSALLLAHWGLILLRAGLSFWIRLYEHCRDLLTPRPSEVILKKGVQPVICLRQDSSDGIGLSLGLKVN